MKNFAFPTNAALIADKEGLLRREWFQLFYNLFQAFNNGALSNSDWTPADGSGAGLVFSNVSANWTQVGNLVHAYARWDYPANANGSSAIFQGLPVLVADEDYALGGVTLNTTSATARDCLLVQNTMTGAFYTGALVPVTNAQMSGATVRIMAIYPLA